MSWVRRTLLREAILAAQGVRIGDAQVMRLAEVFYRIPATSGEIRVAAYHPDTQGVFDIAHLLYGDNIFLDMMDSEEEAWISELLEICLDLMVQATRCIKRLLGEPDDAMVHGHATPQGVYFSNAGIRISEDTATLISPRSIERFVLPMIEKAALLFGGAFAHYCYCGGHGGVSGGANLHPRLYFQLYEAAQNRDLDRLTTLHRQVMRIRIGICSVGKSESSYLKGLKCALSILGICKDFMGEPLQRFKSSKRMQVEQQLQHLGMVDRRGGPACRRSD
jgi:hypothetical protein